MPDAMAVAPMRLACPACLGVALESAPVANGVRVHHCARCGGTWLFRAQMALLRTVPASAVATMTRRANDAGFLCNRCHVPMDRSAAACPACRWKNALECPSCGKRLRRRSEKGVTVDVCRGCEALWLDHHELSLLWAAAAGAVVQARGGTGLDVATGAGDLLEVLVHAPDLAFAAARGVVHLAGSGIELAGQAASHAPALLSSLPEMIGPALEVAGDVAGSVFGVILEIVGGIFDGIG
jgi:Zn-finger nucleic acid-binding protein